MIQKVPKRIDLIAALPKGSVVAEIGVHRGLFSFEMLELPNLGKMYCVDSWCHQPNYDDPVASQDHEENYRLTLQHLSGHLKGGRVEIIRMDSLAAAMLIYSSEVKLDAIFLDSNHSYDSVRADLRAWSRLMKSSGKIFCHDYTNNSLVKKHHWGVTLAVKEFCDQADWEPYAVTNEEFPTIALKKK